MKSCNAMNGYLILCVYLAFLNDSKGSQSISMETDTVTTQGEDALKELKEKGHKFVMYCLSH